MYDNSATLGFDPSRITVAGESVGGNLAAIVAQQAIKRGTFSLAYQILLCPLTDWAGDYEKHRRQSLNKLEIFSYLFRPSILLGKS
ncbi:alpha/beta hydrolase fold domain-containing protein [Paenibacillus phytorum]|uniref:alpha/beta hydrolase fold domain-containing protein n=1 Tax=Paenibacillus phytorum TaxID=2654977 RepID=UPI0028A9484C|nr:alpha/beta hydrolase fold domain-containing protein [Paenibacillus phytorum]